MSGVSTHARQRLLDPVPTIPAITYLRKMCGMHEGETGELKVLEKLADETIREIETTAKEVGGSPYKSQRYIAAVAIRGHIYGLRTIIQGKYEYTDMTEDFTDT